MDMPNNFVFHMLIVLILSIVITAIIMWLIISAGATTKPVEKHAYVTCMDAETREDLRNAMRAGVDQAMKTHTAQMFNVWMKDPTEQPDRAIAGQRNAVRAYVGSRKIANDWNPPNC